jgi:hypothetical protein
MKDYKSSASRLARFFAKSRDQWRANAADKQKKIRALETRVRDLERSREKWKQRAQEAEQAALEGRFPTRRKGGDSDPDDVVHEGEYLARGGDLPQPTPRRHRFDLGWVEWVLLHLLVGLSSLRGTRRLLEACGMDAGEPIPAVSTIRAWLFRIGLFVLQQPIPRRDDWIIILDLTVELGTAKVLAIVGLPQARLQALSGRDEHGCCLGHQDVQCLALEVLAHSTGDVIAECLERLAGRIGGIRQIVADRGSDVRSGIGRYQQRHPEVHATYDVTHQVALWLEHDLKEDPTYNDFRRQCQEAVQKLQQTNLQFLKPPTPRSKARWLQMSGQVSWAQQALAYFDCGQFTELASGYRLDGQTQDRLRGVLSETQRYRLNHRVWRDYDDEASYLNALRHHLGDEAVETHHQALCQAGHLGRRQFEADLGWLLAYREAIHDYSERLAEIERFQQHLKHTGLRTNAVEAFNPTPSENPAVQALHTKMQAYLKHESAGIEAGTVWLATSDVLESLFGKYKLFSQRSPLKEVSRWVLILPLLTVRLSRDLIRQALESVSTERLEHWGSEHFGLSAFARRKAALGSGKKT